MTARNAPPPSWRQSKSTASRASFILRGALAAGAVYGAGAVGPFVSRRRLRRAPRTSRS